MHLENGQELTRENKTPTPKLRWNVSSKASKGAKINYLDLNKQIAHHTHITI